MPFPKPDLCRSCIGWNWPCPAAGSGFIKPSGTGEYGCMLIGEAGGEDESKAGYPFVGAAGMALDKLLRRGKLEKDKFRIANVLSCRPPSNKLVGMPWADDVINHCSPHLDAAIADFGPRSIVCLGAVAFRRVLPEVACLKGVGLQDTKKTKGARGYVFWSDRYNCWVIPTLHPSYALRGKTAFFQVILYDIQRGVEIARDGFSYVEGDYLLDPTPAVAVAWVEEFEYAYRLDNSLFLSVDIETPEKGADEEELDLEDGSDYVIFRCGYSYKDYSGMSIPWGGPYQVIHERLLSHPCDKIWWNGGYDIPRILASR